MSKVAVCLEDVIWLAQLVTKKSANVNGLAPMQKAGIVLVPFQPKLNTMKKHILSTLLMGLLVTLANSELTAQSVITVVGQSKIEASPDQVRINLSINQQSASYDEAVAMLNQRTQKLVQVLLKQDFEEEDIKTTGFNAQPYYEYQNGKRQQKGYSASQNLEVLFVYDQERLGAIVKALSKADVEPNMNISFLLSDEKTASLKQQLLEKAMADAKATAAVLAGTQGKSLDGFAEIRYGVSQNAPQPMYRAEAMMMKAEADADFGGFEAKSIPLTEEVTVIWKVK